MSGGEADKPVRVAVAGLGKMGIMHATMMKAIEGVQVVGLVEPQTGAAKQLQSMGVDAPIFKSIEECLEQAKPDGVVVSTPQFTHRAVAEACLERGVGVLCEKPLAHTLDDARAMVKMAKKYPDVPAGVGYMLAFNPLYDLARETIAAGVLGEVKNCRASCFLSQVFKPSTGWTFTREKSGGGVTINSGVHLLYVLNKVMGPATGVTARAAGVHNEVEDTLSALVDFESGAWGTVEISWSVPGYEFQTHDLWIEGTNGTLEVGNEFYRLWLVEARGDWSAGWSERRRTESEPKARISLSPDYCGDEFYLEDADFIEALRRGRAPKVGWAEGYEVQRLLEAVYRSAEGRRPVELKDV